METIDVKIELKKGAKPIYMTDGSSGADIFASENVIIRSNKTELVKTGIFLEIPHGYDCQIRPRSGLSYKNKIIILNAPGTIDSDYRGEIKVIMHNLSNSDFTIKAGDRIAQMVFTPVVKACFVELKISSTKRNAGGFGHTGVNNND